MDKNFGEMLRQIGNDKTGLANAIEFLRSKNSHTVEISTTDMDNFLVQYSGLMVKYQNLSAKYQSVLSTFDHRLSDFQNTVVSNIREYNDVVNACNWYDSSWFQQLRLSLDAKCSIAQALLDACAQYSSRGNAFWKSIVEKVPSVVASIETPKESE